MNSDTIWQIIDEQRADLANLLAALDAEQWMSPSLCTGWRVRDVAAHLTHSHAGPFRIAVEATKSGFRFNSMVYRMAVEDLRPQAEIIAALRSMIGSRRHIPVTDERGPLMDVLVHGQDIAVPLGIDKTMPIAGAVAAAGLLWHMRFPFNPRRRLDGVRLVASDADFSVGDGPEVSGPIQDIVMLLTGREAGISRTVDGVIGG